MAYGDFTDLKRRTFSDKGLKNKAFNIAKYPKILNMMGIKEESLLWFTSFLIKRLKVVVLLIMRLNRIYNQLKNYTNQLLEIFKKEQFILDL